MNYIEICKSLCKQYSQDFNDWELQFMSSMYDKTNEELTENQMAKILEINRKYRCKR